MESFLKFYVLAHGYLLGVVALLMGPAILLTDRWHHSVEYLGSVAIYCYMGWLDSWDWLLVIAWFLAGCSFTYGLVRHRKRALFPLVLMVGAHVVIALLCDTVTVIALNYTEYWTPFLDLAYFVDFIYALPLVCFTVLALAQLFDETNKLINDRWSGHSFGVYQPTVESAAEEWSEVV